jgi:prepilin-type N-terminal cleavage/methylation domain-containing protein
MTSLRRQAGKRLNAAAFTLVELLVAMAVLALLIGIVAQVVLLTSQAIAINSKKLDAAGQARFFFDRLASDLAARPIRTDLGGTVFNKVAGNDDFQFYSQVPAYGATTATRQISLVSYRVAASTTPSATPIQLQRGVLGTSWTANAANMVYFVPPTPLTGSPAIPNLNSATYDSDYDILADGAFRMEFCYLLNTGKLVSTATAPYSNVSGIVVAIAVLDAQSRKLLGDPASSAGMNAQISAMSNLSNTLHDSQDGNDPLSVWTADFTSSFGSGYPKPAIQNIRFYQRTFYVQ